MSSFLRDLAYAVRLLTKYRGFSAVVVITLALAIGANTVIFSFVNILALRPLPVRQPETIGWLFNVGPQAEGDRSRTSLADFLDFRRSARSFASLAARQVGTATLIQGGDAERLEAIRSTANLIDVWGVKVLMGRGFNAGEDAPGAAPVVVLSHQLWQRRFAGDPAIIGRTVILDDVAHTVVGVLDPAIEIGNLSTIDVWMPLSLDASGAARDFRRLAIAGRLARGVTIEQATAEVHAIAQRLQREYPTTNNGWDARVASTHEAMTGRNTWVILALLALVVMFVLLIACANLANLMLSRAVDRQREIAVRTALGAGRAALVRQLMIESVLLGLVGGAVGLLVAYGGLQAVKASTYEEFFKLLSIDRNALLFVIAATLTTSVAFSLAPAIQTSRTDVSTMLRAGSGKTTGGRRVRSGRSALVVSQIALALSLAVVAVLVVRSVTNVTRIDLGFDRRDLLTFRVDVPERTYSTDRLPALYERMIVELSSLKGVTAVAVAERLPVVGGEAPGPVTVEGSVVAKAADQPWAATSAVGDSYFFTARTPMINGRVFVRTDDSRSPPVAVVNREMAARYWGSPAAAIGKRVALGGASDSPRWLTVVGVSADTRPSDITLPPSPQLYVSMSQAPTRSVAFMIRSPNASTLAADVRAAMRRVDATLPLYEMRTMDRAFAEASSDAMLTGMFSAFAVIALSLAAAGLYGVIAYSVSQRTQEIGIRVALGATGGEVRGMIMRQGGRLLAIGTVVGIAGGGVIASGMRSLLYGVTPLDPSTYAVVIALIVVVMGVATYVPSRRATRVDPVRALRSD